MKLTAEQRIVRDPCGGLVDEEIGQLAQIRPADHDLPFEGPRPTAD